MKKYFTPVFLISFVVILLSFTKKTTNGVEWASRSKITWNDYKDTIPVNRVGDTWTVTGIRYHYDMAHDSILVQVNAYFADSESWAMKDVETAYLLNHCQRNFDISEIYARKFRKIISGYFPQTAFTDFIETNYDTIMYYRKAEEERYEKETNESKNKAMQAKWNKRIDSLLNTYSGFSSPEIHIARRRK